MEREGDERSSVFVPDPAAAGRARRFLRRALAELRAPTEADITEDLLTAGNELVTNAVLHACTGFTPRDARANERVRVEVWDGNTRMPEPCGASRRDQRTGLAVLDALGLDWGVERHRDGKVVWVQA